MSISEVPVLQDSPKENGRVGEIVKLPLVELTHSVPTDLTHVTALKASIRDQGLLAPLIVRREDKTLVDGFHRRDALELLGYGKVDCLVKGYTDL